MEEQRTYNIYPSNLNIVGAIKQFDAYLSKAGYKPNDKSARILRLNVDPYRVLRAESWAEFIDLLEKHPTSMPSFNYSWKKKGNIEIRADVTVYKSSLVISVRSDDQDRVAGLHEELKTAFKASNPLVSTKSINKYNLKKSIFIAHRFDKRGNEIADIIKKCCSLLGFEVKDGMEYESRVIPDKVIERIQSQDIFIVIFTQGKHDWLQGEMAYAKALNKYLIVMAEGSLDFSKGIIGNDFEHIPFPTENVHKCLIDLLSALPR